MDQVIKVTERNREMINQVADRTFTNHSFDQGMLPSGPKVGKFNLHFSGPVWIGTIKIKVVLCLLFKQTMMENFLCTYTCNAGLVLLIYPCL